MKKNKNPTACVIIIGNEILSGRTLDTNKNYLCKELTSNGVDVIESRVIKDEVKKIISVINEVRKKYTYIFTTGGIGPTHDDVTSIAIAKAFKVNLVSPLDNSSISLLALSGKVCIYSPGIFIPPIIPPVTEFILFCDSACAFDKPLFIAEIIKSSSSSLYSLRALSSIFNSKRSSSLNIIFPELIL